MNNRLSGTMQNKQCTDNLHQQITIQCSINRGHCPRWCSPVYTTEHSQSSHRLKEWITKQFQKWRYHQPSLPHRVRQIQEGAQEILKWSYILQQYHQQ